MSMTVQVDRAACMGSRVCMQRAPRTFTLGEDRKARVIGQGLDPEHALRRAERDCPRFAIHLTPESP